MRVTDYGMNFDVDAIRDACTLSKTTLRKVARGMRDKIVRISITRQREYFSKQLLIREERFLH